MPEALPIEPIVDQTTAFAFVLGVLFNQQTRADTAWKAPHRLAERLGGLEPERILAVGEAGLCNMFARSPAIHPFTATMARCTASVAEAIIGNYGSDARNMWTPTVSAGELLKRFTALPGIGEHKARIAIFVATVQLGIPVQRDGGDYSIRSCGKLAQLFHPHHEPVFID